MSAPAKSQPVDVEAIRKDFPILAREVHGVPLVYLDSAATSQKPEPVIGVMDEYYRQHNANVHRGIHVLSEEATEAYEGARKRVAKFINAASWREVIFVRNTTEALNLVVYAWGRANIKQGCPGFVIFKKGNCVPTKGRECGKSAQKADNNKLAPIGEL